MAVLPDTAIVALTFIRILEGRVSIGDISYNTSFDTRFTPVDDQIAANEGLSPDTGHRLRYSVDSCILLFNSRVKIQPYIFRSAHLGCKRQREFFVI